MNRCKDCQAAIESGHYCALCLDRLRCQEVIQSGYQRFLATLPAYADEIDAIMSRVKRFAIPAEKLDYFQHHVCIHPSAVELRKGDSHVTICSTCGCDMFPF